MSRLLDFYRGTAADSEGRRLQDIWHWDDAELDAVHDFIQWLFPLPESSRYSADAPLLSEADIAAFRTEPVMRANLHRSFTRIVSFLGLEVTEGGAVVEESAWALREPNHNWLRITRIIRSSLLLGLEAEARALYERLAAMYRSGRYPIDAETMQYWTDAALGRVPGG
jgi:hypothetical protein